MKFKPFLRKIRITLVAHKTKERLSKKKSNLIITNKCLRSRLWKNRLRTKKTKKTKK